MKVLVVAAHPDDEVLGAGGAISRHIAANDDVTILILGSGLSARLNSAASIPIGDLSELRSSAWQAAAFLGVADLRLFDLPDNRFDSLDLLDIVKNIEQVKNEIQPILVYTHHPGDLNVDHQRTAMAVLTACRPLPGESVNRILAMEVPSATGWGDPSHPFLPNVFVDISLTLDMKIRAMSAYRSEMREFPHARSLESIEARARAWGCQVGLAAAEPFVLLREIQH